jgi:transposase
LAWVGAKQGLDNPNIVPHAQTMSKLVPPLGILPKDWKATPPAVRAIVLALLDQVQSLQTRVSNLEAQLNQHSANSSRPPSSDPPSAPPRPKRTPSARPRGAQPGHPGHQRDLLPTGEVNELRVHRPSTCSHCQAPLPPDLLATDVLRQQVWDLPRVQPHVTEHQFPTLNCPQCQTAVRLPRPPDMPPGAFGPRVAALVALLHGRYRLSHRETTALLWDLYALPLSLGSVPALCQSVSCALAPAYAEVQTAVEHASIVNADETSWKEAGAKRWLWVAVASLCTLFHLAKQRDRAALNVLLGEMFGGIVGSDRYSAYNHLPVERRQVCWAHLKRNWQAFRERDGPVGEWGEAASAQIDQLFVEWYRFREGEVDRAGLVAAMVPVERELRVLVERGRDDLPWEKARGFCRDLMLVWGGLWTFVAVEGVEPTNNVAERALRPAVLWRKGCFGTQSESGNRFVAHILTVSATCRQQERHVLTFLTDAVSAHWAGLPAPSLMTTP